jgi:cobalt-zinc-cadmium efflux system outer membrane protein
MQLHVFPRYAIPILAAALWSAAVPPAGAAPPRGELTLRAALAAALQDNPTLAAGASALHAGDGRVQQAGLLPNPELKLELENFGGSGSQQDFESAETTLRLSQLIELGGKRSRRLSLAGLERDAAQWDYESRRADLAADTARAFVDVLTLQARLRLADDLVQLAGRSTSAVDAQVRNGGAAPVETTRARLANGQAALERSARTRELAAARLALAAYWGSASADFTAVDGRLETLPPPPPLEPLLADVARNPDLARWTTELAAREAAIGVERARAVPDVTVGAGPRYFSDTDEVGVVFEVWMPLPVFDRNQGAVAAATAELARSDADRRAADTGVRSALARAHESLTAAYERARTLRDDMLPAAEAVRAGVEDAYRQGALSSLDVLDAQRTAFGLRDEYLAALGDYHRARIDVDRLAGAPADADADATEARP